MKNLNRVAMLIAYVFMTFMYSCDNELSQSNEMISENQDIDQTELTEFKGLPVKHRFSAPIAELEKTHDYTALKKLYNSKRRAAASKKGIAYKGEEELPSAEIIVEAAEERLNEFPYRENEEAEMNLEMVQEDFPTLTGEEIEVNMDVIDDYYSQNLDYEVLADVAEDENLQAKILTAAKTESRDWGRFWCVVRKFQTPQYVIGAFGYGISTGEFSYIRSVIALYYSNRAVGYSVQSVFGHFAYDNTQRDAYRHVLWSVFLAKYYYTISSKSARLRFAEAIGNANEICTDNPEDSKYMDFHNNAIGRKLFDDNCSYRTKRVLWWRVTYGLNVPSESTLRSRTESFVHSGYFIDKDFDKSLDPIEIDRVTNSIRNYSDKNRVLYFSKEL